MTEFTKLTPSYQGGEFAKPEHVIEVQEAFAPIESELASQGSLLDAVDSASWRARTIQVVGDMHIGWTPQARLDTLAADLLATDGLAALRVFAGDNAEDAGVPTATTTRTYMETTSPSGYRALIGNHDRQEDAVPPWSTVTGQPANWFQDIGQDIRVIGVSPSSWNSLKPITLSSATLTFLAEKLGETTRDCLIVCHAPLWGTVVDGAFTSAADFFAAQENADIRAVLAAHSNARAWISGHTHTAIEAPTLITRTLIGTVPIVAISAGSPAYTGYSAGQAAANPTESGGNTGTPDPLTMGPHPIFTAFVTCYPDRIEVRYRDAATGQWRDRSGTTIDTVTYETESAPLQLSGTAMIGFFDPTILRVAMDTVPQADGASSKPAIVSGVYGPAWDCATTGVLIPFLTSIPLSQDRGTVLIRVKVGAYNGTRRVLFAVGNNGASKDLLHLEYAANSAVVKFEEISNNVSTKVEVTSPYGASHDDLLTYMLRWDGDRMELTVHDVAARASTTRAPRSPFLGTDSMSIGDDRRFSTGRISRAKVESVVLFDRWITDYEFVAFRDAAVAWRPDALAGFQRDERAIKVSGAQPLLRLSAEESRDRAGTVTPTLSGTVNVVAGVYGNTWDVSSGGSIKMSLSTRNRWLRAESGTVLVRATLGAAGALRWLLSIGKTPSVSGDFLYALFQSTTNQIAFRRNQVGGVGSTDWYQTNPLGSSHAGLGTYMLRWDGPLVTWGVNGAVNAQMVRDTVSLVLPSTSFLEVGRQYNTSNPWNGAIEDVLVYDRAISNTEFDYVSGLTEAWSWWVL